MSYRTHITNGKGKSWQVFGNNVCFEPLIEFVKKEGGNVDEDDCYDCEIKDVDRLIEVIEEYIIEQDKRRTKYGGNIFDLRPDKIAENGMSLTYHMKYMREEAIIFASAYTLEFLEDDIERTLNDDSKIGYTSKIKEGHHIYVSAG